MFDFFHENPLVLIVIGLLLIVWDILDRRRKMVGGHPQSSPLVDVTGKESVVSFNQSGGQTARTIVNQAPPKRSIDDNTANKIAEALRSEGAARFTIIDYTGGQDQETHEYKQLISSILKAAGWTAEGFEGQTFLPVGGRPVVGLHLITKTETIPSKALFLSRVLIAHGVSVSQEVIKFPMFLKSDDTVGLAIGRRPE